MKTWIEFGYIWVIRLGAGGRGTGGGCEGNNEVNWEVECMQIALYRLVLFGCQ